MVWRHTKLYSILGVSRKASPSDLDAAFQRLTSQLDNTAPNDQADLANIQDAYAILSNPRERNTYDIAGEAGVWLLHRYRALSMSELVTTAMDVMTHLPSVVSIFFVSFIVGGILAPVLWLCLKIDHIVSWSWAVAFLPIWIADLVHVWNLIKFFLRHVQGCECHTQSFTGFVRHLALTSVKLVKCVLFVVFQILVVKALEGEIPLRDVQRVFLPYYLLEGVASVDAIVTGFRSHFQLVRVWSFVRLATALLLAHKLDKSLEINWWLVFAPLLVFVVLMLSKSLVRWCRRMHQLTSVPLSALTQTASYDAVDQVDQIDQRSHGASIRLFLAFLSLVFYSPLLLLPDRLQAGTTFSSLALFSLWFALGLAVLLSTCFFFCCRKRDREVVHDGETTNGVVQHAV
ncbi:Aste57867_11605 [Aphanomyces stellatus]|uniref:Aste57867_11605 protein n=1 Tax=Aphanomyces stellatus TaxID=120398 RepID=A0A485KTQ3_9STRA|nr:hypothetical protein As57867_011562 [Aphanomyces stellatus]VFT88463.1 Aste57867_11605 [Aphanomyces stellatus]